MPSQPIQTTPSKSILETASDLVDKAGAAVANATNRVIDNVSGHRSPAKTINFVYPSYLNDTYEDNEETSQLNFMMFFGMHLNNEKDGDVVICLPIPKSGLSDDLTAGWSMKENAAETIINTAKRVTTDQSAESVTSNVANLAGNVLGSKSLVGVKSIRKGMALFKEIGGTAKGDTGIPIFEKMNNRQHEFSWEFTPTSIQEANTIIGICNTFKLGTLPFYKKGQPNLSFPPRWNIKTRFSRYGVDFKTSVIKSCKVVYGGGSSYNEFQVGPSDAIQKSGDQRGMPTKITLSLTFMEIAKPNTLLITDPNRQRNDNSDNYTATRGKDDKWAQAKEYAKGVNIPASVGTIASTGFFDAETFSGNATFLD